MNAVMRRFYDLTFERINRLYCHLLEFFLKRRLDFVLAMIALFVVTFLVPFKKLEVVEQQEEDQTSFEIGVEFASEYSFEDVGDYFAEAEKMMEEKKDEYGLKGYFTFYRRQFGRLEGWFDDTKKRPFSAKEVGERLVKELPKRPGIKLHFGRENQEDAKNQETFEFRIEGMTRILDQVAARLELMIQHVDGVIGIRSGEDPF
jgi:multidrug efflux pump subunit AcrB